VGRNCPKCGAPLVKRKGRYGEFIACSAFPKCRYIEKTEKEKEYSDEVCDKCGGRMVIKTGKRGKFLACENYPKCKNTKPLKEKK
jgi:DNA topoisomerase-1